MSCPKLYKINKNELNDFLVARLVLFMKYKADLIAVEAGETIIVDQEEVVKYANKHNIVIMAV